MSDEKDRIPEEKRPEAAGFDMDVVTGQYTTSVQTFNRIRDIRAVDGMVLVLVDEKRMDPGIMTARLRSTLMSVREAAKRAEGLNQMLGMLPDKSDRATAQEIVEATIAACREAQKQKQEGRTSTATIHSGFKDDPKEILEAAYPEEARFTEAMARQKGLTVEEMRREQLQQLAMASKMGKKEA